MARPKAPTLHKTCALPGCGRGFDVPDKVNYRERLYCSRPCSNRATAAQRAETVRAAKRYTPPVCPCGAEVPPPPGQSYVYKEQKKFCSPEHRALYGAKRQADPGNYITFTCLNPACGKEVTRRKKLNGRKYCSNECSAKHNRTKQHILVEDSMVLDSPYEALFYGLCRLWKIEIDRADRGLAIPFGEKGWYCPDFYLPQLDLWVEVKGFEDDDDRARCDEWRKTRQLAVIRREELHVLRTRANDGVVREQLRIWAAERR